MMWQVIAAIQNLKRKTRSRMHPLLPAMTCTFRHAETSLGPRLFALRPESRDRQAYGNANSHRETVKVQPGIELGRMRRGVCQARPGVNKLAGGRGRRWSAGPCLGGG